MSEGRAQRALALAQMYTRMLQNVLEEEHALFRHLHLGQPIHLTDKVFPIMYHPIFWRQAFHSSPGTFDPKRIHDENMAAAKLMEQACVLAKALYEDIKERVDFLAWLKSIEPITDWRELAL